MKFMNMKRFGSVVMAGALALSLAVPAFATTTTPKGQVTITGTYEDIPISVSVPTSGQAQINPYGLPVDFTLSDTVTKVAVSGQQITTKPLSIRNQGTTKLSVNATLAVATDGTDNGVSVKNADLQAAQKGKEINLALQVATLDDVKYAVSSLDTTLEDNIIKAFAADATWASAKTLKAKDTPAATAIAAAPVAKSSDTVANGGCGGAMAALGAATVGAGDLVTYGKDSIAVFRLTGKVNESPVKTVSGSDVDDPWTANDKFSAQVVFKFKPYKDATLTVSATGGVTNITGTGTGAATATFDAGDTGLTVTKYDWTSGTMATATCTAGGAANSTTTTVTGVAAGTTEIKCVATLSDGTTKQATITFRNR